MRKDAGLRAPSLRCAAHRSASRKIGSSLHGNPGGGSCLSGGRRPLVPYCWLLLWGRSLVMALFRRGNLRRLEADLPAVSRGRPGPRPQKCRCEPTGGGCGCVENVQCGGWKTNIVVSILDEAVICPPVYVVTPLRCRPEKIETERSTREVPRRRGCVPRRGCSGLARKTKNARRQGRKMSVSAGPVRLLLLGSK